MNVYVVEDTTNDRAEASCCFHFSVFLAFFSVYCTRMAVSTVMKREYCLGKAPHLPASELCC